MEVVQRAKPAAWRKAAASSGLLRVEQIGPSNLCELVGLTESLVTLCAGPQYVKQPEHTFINTGVGSR